jgi:hypothetical protein
METRLSLLVAALLMLFGAVANALSLPEAGLKESQVGPATPPSENWITSVLFSLQKKTDSAIFALSSSFLAAAFDTNFINN